MKNEPSTRTISLIKIVIFGGLGLMLLSLLQLLTVWIRMFFASQANMSNTSLLTTGVLLLILAAVFLWASLNIIVGIGLSLALKIDTLVSLLAITERLPFRLNKWLFRPYVSIIRWTIELRKTTQVD